MLYQSPDGSIAAWEMNGTNPILGQVLGNPGSAFTVMGLEDFNNDGHADILMQTAGGTIGVWSVTGNSALSVAGSLTGNPGAPYHVVANLQA